MLPGAICPSHQTSRIPAIDAMNAAKPTREDYWWTYRRGQTWRLEERFTTAHPGVAVVQVAAQPGDVQRSYNGEKF